MGELLSDTNRLEEVLKERSTVKIASAGEYVLTFGSIIYNGFEILCQIESNHKKNMVEWALHPLGIRAKKRDFFDCKEEYYELTINQEEFKSLLLNNLDGSNCELISQVNLISTDQTVASFGRWNDKRNKEVFKTVLEEIDIQQGTAAVSRVVVTTKDNLGHEWVTVGASENIIEASLLALQDAYEYGLRMYASEQIKEIRPSTKREKNNIKH